MSHDQDPARVNNSDLLPRRSVLRGLVLVATTATTSGFLTGDRRQEPRDAPPFPADQHEPKPQNITEANQKLAEGQRALDEVNQNLPHEGFFENGGILTDFLSSNIIKGLSLAADAAVLYIGLANELPEGHDRIKLNAAMSLAHGVLMAAGTLMPRIAEKELPQLQRVINIAAGSLAIGFVMNTLASEDEIEEEVNLLVNKVTAAKGLGGIAKLAASGAVLAVSYDALFSGTGAYSTMTARHFNTEEIMASTAIITGTVFATLAAADMIVAGTKQESSKLPEHIQQKIRSACRRATNNIATVFGIETVNEHGQPVAQSTVNEETVMSMVYALITSYGARGVMHGLGYEGHNIGPLGITVESLAVGLMSQMLYGHSATVRTANDALIGASPRALGGLKRLLQRR